MNFLKTATSLVLCLWLTGCATGCREACIFGFGPGNAAFDRVALHYDREDACQGGPGTSEARRQELGRPEGYQIPSWCGSGRGYSRPISVYDNQGRRIAIVK